MNIEGGGLSAGPAVSVGPAAGPSVATITPNIVNEGPVGPSFLENTVPFEVSGLNPKVETSSNPFQEKEFVDPAEAVAWVESFITQDRADSLVESKVLPEADQFEPPKAGVIQEPEIIALEAVAKSSRANFLPAQAFLGLVVAKTILPLHPAVEPAEKLHQALGSQTGAEAISHAVVSTLPLVYTEPQAAAEASEAVGVEAEEIPERDEREKKKIEEKKITHSVDPKIFKRRLEKINLAAVAAQDEAEREGVIGVEAWRVRKYLSAQDRNLRGEDLENADPGGSLIDGTWEANMTGLGGGIFSSAEEVAEKAPQIISQDPPVQEGEGQEVGNKPIATTYKHAPEKAHPAQLVITRVVKKNGVINLEPKKKSTEPTVESLGLGEVFKKAA